MPYDSDRQRRFVHAKAAQGVPWARKYAAHSDAALRSAKAVAKQWGANNAVGKADFGSGHRYGVLRGKDELDQFVISERARRAYRKAGRAQGKGKKLHEKSAKAFGRANEQRSLGLGYSMAATAHGKYRGVGPLYRGDRKHVGKAMSSDDRKTLGAAGVGAAGLGTLRIGGEMTHRATTAVPRATATLNARRGKLVAAKTGLKEHQARIDAGTTAVPRAGWRGHIPTKDRQPTIGRQKEWVKNAELGVREARASRVSTAAGVQGRLRTATKTKYAGLGLAAAGAAGTVHYFRAANRNRAASAYEQA